MATNANDNSVFYIRVGFYWFWMVLDGFRVFAFITTNSTFLVIPMVEVWPPYNHHTYERGWGRTMNADPNTVSILHKGSHGVPLYSTVPSSSPIPAPMDAGQGTSCRVFLSSELLDAFTLGASKGIYF